MKTLLSLTALCGLILLSPAHASRILEIEEFYHSKVKDLLETRFPETPFSIYVTVDTGRLEPSRREVQLNRGKKKTAQLPYWYGEDEEPENISIWDRMDIPLGTLIKEVKSIRINVQVDATLNEAEMAELKEAIAKQLKLDAATDGIEISRMPWSNQERYRNLTWVGGLALAAFLLIFIVFGLMARYSINSLIRGLSQPIAEIGKSTQKFANSALNLATDLSSKEKTERSAGPEESSGADAAAGLNLLEVRKNALELLERNQALFETPDAEFMDFLERKGHADPVTMGSILAELPDSTLRSLFKFGSGDWWYKAIAQPAPLRSQSLALLGEIDRLRVRRHFGRRDGEHNERHREASLILNRLKTDELTLIMKGVDLSEGAPVIDLLPRDRGLAVAKALFPGQWAVFLQPRDSTDPKSQVLEEMRKKALHLKPLRGEDEIQAFFKDLDLSEYLDVASPRDERDFYVVLPEDSRVRKQRFPFFKVFEGEENAIKAVASMFSPREWALALSNCDGGEQRGLLEKFPDRLRYQVIEHSSLIKGETIDPVSIRRARRAIVNAFVDEAYRQATIKAGELLDGNEGSDSNDTKIAA